MGSFIEINDTLRITKEQGFPKELDYEKHISVGGGGIIMQKCLKVEFLNLKKNLL